jgi:hypothetical protein
MKRIEDDFILCCFVTEEDLAYFEELGHWPPVLMLHHYLTFSEFWCYSINSDRLVYRIEVSSWEKILDSSNKCVAYHPIISDVEPVFDDGLGACSQGISADVADVTTRDLDGTPCLHASEFRIMPNWILDEATSDKAKGAIIASHQLQYLAYRRDDAWEAGCALLAEANCKGSDLQKKLAAGQGERIHLPDRTSDNPMKRKAAEWVI